MTRAAGTTEHHERATDSKAEVQNVMTPTLSVGKMLECDKTGETGADVMTQVSEVRIRPSWMDEDTSEIQPNLPKKAESQTTATKSRPSWMDEDTSEIQPNPPKAVSRKTSTAQTRLSWMDEDTSEIQPNAPMAPKEEELSETEMGTPGKQRAKLGLLKKPKVLIFKTIDDMLGNVVRMAIDWFMNIFPQRK